MSVEETEIAILEMLKKHTAYEQLAILSRVQYSTYAGIYRAQDDIV